MVNFGLKGRVFCVTGGASGIGKETVLQLARDGASVAILDLRAEDVDVVLEEVRDIGTEAQGFVLDVRDVGATRAVVEAVESSMGDIYGLVASAGVSGAGKAEAIPIEEWSNVLAVNATGLFVTCQEVGKYMIKRRSGVIVAVGSCDGLSGHPGRTHYVASKFAVTGLVKNLALEWGRYGIRVNGVAPNLVDTPLVRRGVPPRFITEVVEDRTPLGRIARSSEIASAAVMLLSDAASYVTGVMLPVDGGLTAGYFTHAQGADLSSNHLLEAGVYREI